MTDQRGLSLLELLVAAALATLVAGALFSAYVATTRSFGESGAQTALQRQGTLVLEEIGRQVRGAIGPNALTMGTCNGVPESLRVKTIAGNVEDVVCYYARDDGALCEVRATSPTTCRNLLAGGLKTIALWQQPAVPDLRCPLVDGNPIPANGFCFTMARAPSFDSPIQVDLAFAISDGDRGLDGVNVMAFSTSLTCSGRNC